MRRSIMVGELTDEEIALIMASKMRNTGCERCDSGMKPVKMKRQKVHYVNRKIEVCTNKDNI